MATRSKTFTGRYDELVEELKAIVAAQKSATTDAAKLNRFAAAVLDQIGAQPKDTVNLSVNSDQRPRTSVYTVTLTHTPAPDPAEETD